MIAVEMLCGLSPFSHIRVGDKEYTDLAVQQPHLLSPKYTLPSGVDPRLADAITRCLQVEPSCRISASEFLRILDAPMQSPAEGPFSAPGICSTAADG